MAEDSGPEPIGEILSKLFSSRGWGRRQERINLERAWEEAIGPEFVTQTRVAGLRRKILEVHVKGAVLLQELSQFHRRKILEKLKQKLGAHAITDVKFKAGNW